jgi:hypothetical protein
MPGGYRVTVRRRGRTQSERYARLDEALRAVQQNVATAARRDAEQAFMRTVEPVQQVALRVEVRGPGGVRGGIDVRGDGSAEAFTGRLVRKLVRQQPGEDAIASLRRALGT